jgi:RND family efflux transporter MFP subunit
VKEGQRVKRGEVLGLLDDRKYVAELENAKIAFEKARIELEDMLLGQGFELKDSARIPKERFRTACVRSGFADAKLSVASAKRALEQTRIVAPIAGVVCNLEAKAHNLSSAFEQFCEITDNSDFQVVFSLLETELQDLNVGQVLRVSPFSMTDCVCRAEVMSVNPLVDEKGMVRVRAVVRAAKTGLLEGMNVKVVLLQRVENCLMVPKSAIVLRQNRKVVFVHENGLAIWKYVTTGLENSEFVQITDGLKAGESAIIDQNFNLAHEGKVKVLADEMAK